MWVNPFWLGILLTLVLEVIVAIIFSIVSGHRQEEEEMEVSTDEYKKILEDMTGQKFNVKVVNGYLVGEPVEDKDDEAED